MEGFNEEGTAPFILLPRGIYLRPVPEEESFWTGAAQDSATPWPGSRNPCRSPGYTSTELPPCYAPTSQPSPPQRATTRAWAGFYDTSFDSKPVVHRFAEGLVVAGGTSGSGIMKADSVGRAATLALGEEEAVLHGGGGLSLEQLGLDGQLVEQEKLVI